VVGSGLESRYQVVNHLTARLKAALEMIDIRVIDYIIIGETIHTRIAASVGWIAIELSA
jgi:DNA repair protein RadC